MEVSEIFGTRGEFPCIGAKEWIFRCESFRKARSLGSHPVKIVKCKNVRAVVDGESRVLLRHDHAIHLQCGYCYRGHPDKVN